MCQENITIFYKREVIIYPWLFKNEFYHSNTLALLNERERTFFFKKKKQQTKITHTKIVTLFFNKAFTNFFFFFLSLFF